MIRDRFDHDQHELLVRQLLHIRQNHGLWLCSMIHFSHRPAYCLQFWCQSYLFHHSFHWWPTSWAAFNSACSMPENLGCCLYSGPIAARVRWTSWGDVNNFTAQVREECSYSDTSPSSLENKLVAVKAYRKDMGLCYKCGVKWSKDPKCSPKVLHAIRSAVEERFRRSPAKQAFKVWLNFTVVG